MMKKRFLVIALLLVLLGLPTVALASDISGAHYYGLIQVSNNSTATTNVATTCNISTQNLIDGNYLNSSANNCVIRTSSGADVPFMPAVNATYPWCIWVPSIGTNSYQNDILYTANSTGGEIRYFPGSGGMTTTDSASLEPGDNFTMEQSGWVDTSYPYTPSIDDFTAYTEVDANGKLTVTSHKAEATDADRDEDVYLYRDMGANYWDALYIDFEIYIASTSLADAFGGMAITNTVGSHSSFAVTDITCSALYNGAEYRFYLYRGVGVASDHYVGSADTPYYCTLERVAGNDNVTLKIYSDSARITLLDTLAVSGFGTTKFQYVYGFVNYNSAVSGRDFDGYVQNLSLADIKRLVYKPSAFGIYISGTGNITASIDGGASVTASGISSGEYTVRTWADTSYLHISIDGVESDNASLGGVSVPDTSGNLIYYENIGGYWDYTRIWIDGVLQQDIIWENSTTFTDQSGNSHDATPTFRTTSSDTDVSAELVSFQPVAEAQAPDYALGTAPPFIDPSITGNVTGTFTTTPGAGTFPLAGVITAVANATNTPPQLPLLIIAVFIILAASLTVSALMRQYGSGSLLAKIGVIVAFMGVFIALGNFAIDFWMLVVFLIIAISIAFMSKQVGWT